MAGFIGSPGMAFGRFGVERSPGGVVLSHAAARFELELTDDLPDEVIVGVRPEDQTVRTDEPGLDERRLLEPIDGAVTYVEDLGREWFAGVEFDEGSSFVVRGSSHPIPEIASRVTFGFRPGGVYLFDPQSEACLFRPEGGREVPVGLPVGREAS